MASGVLTWWYLGRVAADRLEQRGPELLTLLRHGRSTTEQAKKTAALAELPAGVATSPTSAWASAPSPVPKAVVPAVFELTGNDDTKSWFLALHLDSRWRWPVITHMATLGLTMYAYGALTDLKAKKASRPDG